MKRQTDPYGNNNNNNNLYCALDTKSVKTLKGNNRETRRLKSFPWDALVYGSIMAFYLNLEKLGKPERCVMSIDE